ncbi:hypothetical protein, variant 1 [Aphanomyces invadans]|uniref:GPR180/TMEM145 transmembrane domain-containing protein n=1 Tax=Aphanomyces invadans TaxID=157072 RepID=A0A024UEY8_9STRA|nr:hypothetical protein, variant 1 [Aphanomyces invadans]ETW04951.1 hypothetical protein, variant 1 [Aphanomyces invadans]|eukprot:XP_008866391.1 hypothetical protein, variant 1 [Aphanomyces invadans]
MQLLRRAAAGAAVLLIRGADGIKAHFSHRFEYEDFMAAPMNANSMVVRWNSQCPVQEFGMEVGAEVVITVEHAEAPVAFSLFNYEQWATYRSLVFDVASLEAYKETLAITCMHAATTRVMFDPTVDALNTTYKIQIAASSQYTFQVESCTMQNNFVNASISMVNLGWDNELSEHMGVEQLGLIPLYKVVTAMYALGTVAWLADCLVKTKYTPTINFVLAAALVGEAAKATTKLLYYKDFSANGIEHSVVATARNVFEGATDTVFMSFLVLCAMGWSWSRRKLTLPERRFFSMVLVLYSTVATIKATCSAKEPTCQAYFLTEYAIKSLVMLGIIIALNYNITRMQMHSDGMRWHGDNVPVHYACLELLRNFRLSFVAYLLMPSVVVLVNAGLLLPPGSWRLHWASCMNEELFMLGIYCHLAYTLRPMSPSVFQVICKPDPPTE